MPIISDRYKNLSNDYIKMLPSSSFIDKLNTFHPGTCITYGSAFKMPSIVNIDQPNPEPLSQNIDISSEFVKNIVNGGDDFTSEGLYCPATIYKFQIKNFVLLTFSIVSKFLIYKHFLKKLIFSTIFCR